MRIRASGIVKDFGTGAGAGVGAALAGVELDVRSGELMALLGPSGSGKTTLLRVIAGLEPPDAGRILFGEEDATAIPVARRGVGFVFQHYALFRHLSVRDNIAFGLKVQSRERLGRAEIGRRVGELLRLVQLDGLEARYPNQLSGGQRQRVALARALAIRPRVLLLDEPFGALDARVRKDLRRSLRDIHDATGQTTIFVTHDQDEALELADRVAILNAGRVEQIGTPDEVHDEPGSAFVMGFVGESAKLAVEIRDGVVHYRGARLSVPPQGLPDGPAALFLRPQDVSLASGPDGLSGTITIVRRAAGGRRAEIKLDATSVDATSPGATSRDLVETELGTREVASRGDLVRVAIVGGRVFPARV